jgi:hypothetical protein
VVDGDITGLHKEASNTKFQQGIVKAESGAEFLQRPLHKLLFGERP